MSLLVNVIATVVVLVIVYYIVNYYFDESKTIATMKPANIKQTISASTLPNNSNNSNYTYSLWFYIDDWNYRYGEKKVMLSRTLKDSDEPGPIISLDSNTNNVCVEVMCYPRHNSKPQLHKCKIKNVPMQKWSNLTVSLYNRTLDLYLDGKLVRTCMLPGVVKVRPEADIEVCPDGGYSGWISNVKYWADASNPQQVYNIYKSGFGGSLFGNILNKYKIRLSFVEDNKEQGSIEI